MGLLVFSCSVNGEEINYLIIGDAVSPLQFSEKYELSEKGIITEIVTKLFQGSPYQLTIKEFPWRRQMALIEGKKAPNWLIYALPEWLPTKAHARISNPLFKWQHALISRKAEPFTDKPIPSFQNKTLLLIKFFDYPGLNNWEAKNQFKFIREVTTNITAIRLTHKLPDQVFVAELGRSYYSISKLGLTPDEFIFEDFSDIIATKMMTFAYDAALPSTFTNFLNKRIDDLKSKGEIKRILKKYHWIPD